MKIKSLLSLAFVSVSMFYATESHAQYCDAILPAGSSVCNPNGSLTTPGLQDLNTLACIVRGQNNDVTIQFKNYDQFPNPPAQVVELRIDSMTNLPCGMCWSVSESDFTYNTLQDGCFRLTGFTNDAVGQYKIKFSVAAKIGGNNFFIPIADANDYGIPFYVRVIESGQNCPAVNIGGASNTASSNCPVSVDEVKSAFGALEVSPNPMNKSAQVRFFFEGNSSVTEQIVDVMGAVISSREIDAVQGENRIAVQADYPSGIYYYTLKSDKSVSVKRIVIQ